MWKIMSFSFGRTGFREVRIDSVCPYPCSLAYSFAVCSLCFSYFCWFSWKISFCYRCILTLLPLYIWGLIQRRRWEEVFSSSLANSVYKPGLKVNFSFWRLYCNLRPLLWGWDKIEFIFLMASDSGWKKIRFSPSICGLGVILEQRG